MKPTHNHEDEFWFDGECIAWVVVDSDGDYAIEYNIQETLYLGAVQLLYNWEQDMYKKYTERT